MQAAASTLVQTAMAWAQQKTEIERVEAQVREFQSLLNTCIRRLEETEKGLKSCVGRNIQNKIFATGKGKVVVVRWSAAPNMDARVTITLEDLETE